MPQVGIQNINYTQEQANLFHLFKLSLNKEKPPYSVDELLNLRIVYFTYIKHE